MRIKAFSPKVCWESRVCVRINLRKSGSRTSLLVTLPRMGLPTPPPGLRLPSPPPLPWGATASDRTGVGPPPLPTSFTHLLQVKFSQLPHNSLFPHLPPLTVTHLLVPPPLPPLGTWASLYLTVGYPNRQGNPAPVPRYWLPSPEWACQPLPRPSAAFPPALGGDNLGSDWAHKARIDDHSTGVYRTLLKDLSQIAS